MSEALDAKVGTDAAAPAAAAVFNSERRLSAGGFIFLFLLLRTNGQLAVYALMQAVTAASAVNGWSGADRFWLGAFVFPCRSFFSRGSTT
ncbi:MAG: hypothetical protein BHW60_07805 [Sutterella sp. 54_7]|nr:MAG: hypothetical protein BHW60_07805 [Sutterella sp. 54_7]